MELSQRTEVLDLSPISQLSFLPLDEREKERIETARQETWEHYVVQANDIVRKKAFTHIEFTGDRKDYYFSLASQKILRYLISRIKPLDLSIEPLDCGITEFCEICGINTTNDKDRIRQLRIAIDEIKKMTFWAVTDKRHTSISWLAPYTVIDAGSRTIHISLEPMLAAFFIGQAQLGSYTQYQLHDIMMAKSKHTIPLYELFTSLLHKGNVLVFEIAKLREALDCASYKSFTNFRNKVLDPAIEEINRYTMLKVETYGEDPKRPGRPMYFKPIKDGRAISRIEFSIRALFPQAGEGAERYENVEIDMEKQRAVRRQQIPD